MRTIYLIAKEIPTANWSWVEIIQGDLHTVSIELGQERNKGCGLIEKMNKLLKQSNSFSHL